LGDGIYAIRTSLKTAGFSGSTIYPYCNRRGIISLDILLEVWCVSVVTLGALVRKTFRAMAALPQPEILTIPIPPKPIGVETAAIVSLSALIKTLSFWKPRPRSDFF